MAWQAWFAPYTPLLHFTQVPGRERGRQRSEAGPSGAAGVTGWVTTSVTRLGGSAAQDQAVPRSHKMQVTSASPTLRDDVNSCHNGHQTSTVLAFCKKVNWTVTALFVYSDISLLLLFIPTNFIYI